MNYIITESQLNQVQFESLKDSIFQYWNKYGVIIDKGFMNIFSLKKDDKWRLVKLVFEYYGGFKEVYKKFESLTDKKFNAIAGSYDFDFKITKFSLEEDEIFITVVLDPKGKVSCEKEGKTFDNIYDAYMDEEIGWEIEDEIKDTIYENEIFNEWYKMGFEIHIETIYFGKV